MENKGVFKNLSLITILLIPVAIAINFCGFQIKLLLSLPIYLDCIGTVLVGVLAGPVAGLIAGFLSIATISIAAPPALPYSIVAALAGLTAGLLSRKKMFTNLWKTLISGIIIALVSTASAAPITLIVYGGASAGGNALVTVGLLSMGLSMVHAVFSAELITDLIDKVLSAFIVYFVIKNISSRYLSKLKYGHLYLKKQEQSEETTAA